MHKIGTICLFVYIFAATKVLTNSLTPAKKDKRDKNQYLTFIYFKTLRNYLHIHVYI